MLKSLTTISVKVKSGAVREESIRVVLGLGKDLAGCVGDDPDAADALLTAIDLAEGGIEGETRQTMENIKASLHRHGLEMSDIIKCTVYLADISEWPSFNEVYAGYFDKDRYPARSALAASGLALGARVELECMAAQR